MTDILTLKPGDRVRLTPAGITRYGGVPSWVPDLQGSGHLGTVLMSGPRPNDALRPYFVAWDNGVMNSYRVEDLEMVTEPRAFRFGVVGP